MKGLLPVTTKSDVILKSGLDSLALQWHRSSRLKSDWISGDVWGELVERSLLWMNRLHVQQVLGGPQLVDEDEDGKGGGSQC